MNALPKTVLVPLAPGFEEIEAVAIIDVLRRAGLTVTSAGLSAGPVVGAHGLNLMPDTTIAGIAGRAFDAIVLPGGMPGAQHLADHAGLREILQTTARRGAITAAICAAPMALATAGLLQGRRATCYPGFEGRLTGAKTEATRVVVDGPIITGRGPGTAIEFALAVVAALVSEAKAKELSGQMIAHNAA